MAKTYKYEILITDN